MKVREAVAGDAEAIAKVSVDCWKTTYKGIVPTTYLKNMSYAKRYKKWKKQILIEDVQTYVGQKENGEVVGFCDGGPVRKENLHETFELYAIYILEKAQGQGIGKSLLYQLVSDMTDRGYKHMIVWVLEKNDYRRFYEKLKGRLYGKDEITLEGERLPMVAYTFSDLSALRKNLL
ncbi:GNAT family N-acetyltransferase [Halobacillus sp. A1]|uniref:GNAT family N-acetyltransferase n=1 Tax=Halobacillus sp. A1 TaxID=2880262 RepID=UPI0020A632AC|nr:GNAT family N-acetyltransferase [Halobacillus sp. A1]MCP3032454.1 GNAT family N-acetyltransferase [Halobacillus sp. A1]